jgi:hypothetical protein
MTAARMRTIPRGAPGRSPQETFFPIAITVPSKESGYLQPQADFPNLAKIEEMVGKIERQ